MTHCNKRKYNDEVTSAFIALCSNPNAKIDGKIIKNALRNGFNPNSQEFDCQKRTPLMLLIEKHAEVVEVFIKVCKIKGQTLDTTKCDTFGFDTKDYAKVTRSVLTDQEIGNKVYDTISTLISSESQIDQKMRQHSSIPVQNIVYKPRNGLNQQHKRSLQR